jgi:2-desacetyl-2-hydroxyethyl bacteriochlorophyllide A dehydrogenase
MKAAVFRRSKGLVLEDLPIPDPGSDGVLVKVSDTGFCGSDHSLLESGLLPDGIILGHEVSGTVAAWGERVNEMESGLRVVIRPTFCGGCRECLLGRPHLCKEGRRTIGIGDLPGGFAEYVKVYPQMVIPVPKGVDSRNAALAETFASALHGIRYAGAEGGSVLVVGGGPIGLAAVKLLKLQGFGPIALSEPLKEKRDIARLFGADFTIDPLHENLRESTQQWTRGIGFDTILECSGLPENVPLGIELAAKRGCLCIISIIFKSVAIPQPTALNFKEIRVAGSYSNTHSENVRILDLMSEGKIDARPLITDLIPLDSLPRVYEQRIHAGKAVKAMLRIGEEF